jgi:hypothetical protein
LVSGESIESSLDSSKDFRALESGNLDIRHSCDGESVIQRKVWQIGSFKSTVPKMVHVMTCEKLLELRAWKSTPACGKHTVKKILSHKLIEAISILLYVPEKKPNEKISF